MGFRNGARRKSLNAVTLNKEVRGHTLQPAALVNETYMRLIKSKAADGHIARISLLWRRK
jgi:hypothetical protein